MLRLFDCRFDYSFNYPAQDSLGILLRFWLVIGDLELVNGRTPAA